jgi:hypothetical protein
MYNNGNSSKNVTGASVVDGTLENADFADNGLSGDKIDGGIISNFQSTGIDDRLPTGKVLTLSATGVDVTGSVSSDQAIVANDVTSTGITGAQASYGVLVNAATGSGKYSHGLGFIAGTIAGAGIGSYDGGSGGRQDMWFATRSQYNVYAEKARISHDGYFRLATGGIQFNGDTAAANALDDYEEGTWTPVLTGNSGTKTVGSGNAGTYTKIGNVVTLNATVIWNGTETVGNYPKINGFPFAVSGRASATFGGRSGMTMSNPYFEFRTASDPTMTGTFLIESNRTMYSHNTITYADSGAIYGFTITYHTT